MSRLLYRIGRFSAAHKWRMLLLWVLAMVVTATLGQRFGGDPADSFEIPGTESQTAFDLLDSRFPAQSGSTAQVVFHTDEGTLRDGAAAQAIIATLGQIATADHVSAVTSPLADDGADLMSDDGTIAYAEMRFDVKAQDAGLESVESLEAAADVARQAGLQVELGGDVVTSNSEEEPPSSELIGLAWRSSCCWSRSDRSSPWACHCSRRCSASASACR